eukprot:m.42421 g.42421  ORF g.42421 m.42421 type:complete len:93 (-) comp10688_c0_seq2:1101-1379(-)
MHRGVMYSSYSHLSTPKLRTRQVKILCDVMFTAYPEVIALQDVMWANSNPFSAGKKNDFRGIHQNFKQQRKPSKCLSSTTCSFPCNNCTTDG